MEGKTKKWKKSIDLSKKTKKKIKQVNKDLKTEIDAIKKHKRREF